MLQKYVWEEVTKSDQTFIYVVLDELIRAAVDAGVGSQRCQIVGETVATLTSIGIRGRILSKVRKVYIKLHLERVSLMSSCRYSARRTRKPPRTYPRMHIGERSRLLRTLLSRRASTSGIHPTSRSSCQRLHTWSHMLLHPAKSPFDEPFTRSSSTSSKVCNTS
jgi:hypothetical protein